METLQSSRRAKSLDLNLNLDAFFLWEQQQEVSLVLRYEIRPQ
jgi:hypothetical protein